MDEPEKQETQRRKDAKGDEWQPLFDSLAMFSEDFMAGRVQPPVQERETLEPLDIDA